MGKMLDKLGKFEDFKAPWETETGSDAEIDAAKFKKFLYNLETDKAKAQDAATEAAEKVKVAEDALKAAQDEFAKGDQSGELAKAQDALRKAEGERDAAQSSYLRLEVAVEKNLTPAQAKRLQGTTKEELEADADELLEAFPAAAPKEQAADDEELEPGDEGYTRPRATTIRVTNPGDPNPGGGKEIDFEAEAAKIVGGPLL